MRVTMLVANDLVHDGRVRKTAATVAAAGHRVQVLGLASDAAPAGVSDLDGFELRLVPRVDPAEERLVAAKDAERAALSALKASRRELRLASRKQLRLRRRARTWRTVLARLRLERELRRRRRALARAAAEHERLCAALEEEHERHAAQRRRTGGLDRYAASWLPHLLEAPVPDILHVHDFHGLETAFRAVETWGQQGARPRVIYDAHEYLVGREATRGNGSTAIVDFEARWAPKADEVIVVSKTIAAELRRSGKSRREPEVVYNLPARLNGSSRPVRGLRAVLGLDGEPLVVYAGASNERRGIDLLVRGVALLEDVRLALVVPPGKLHTEELLALAGSLGASDRVHVAPFAPVDRVVPYLADADVGAFTPRDDGVSHAVMPNKLFQYLHAGLGLLVADVGEIAEFVRSTGSGETHRPGDPEDCARALRRLLDDPARYRERREELVEQWSWEAQEPRLLAVYDRLAAR